MMILLLIIYLFFSTQLWHFDLSQVSHLFGYRVTISCQLKDLTVPVTSVVPLLASNNHLLLTWVDLRWAPRAQLDVAASNFTYNVMLISRLFSLTITEKTYQIDDRLAFELDWQRDKSCATPFQRRWSSQRNHQSLDCNPGRLRCCDSQSLRIDVLPWFVFVLQHDRSCATPCQQR